MVKFSLVGKYILVKNNIFCPDYNSMSISNWRGTVIKIINSSNGPLLLIKWDSNTIESMPYDYINDSKNKKLNYHYMYLKFDKILEYKKSNC
ncbi:hypothetical protein CCS79_03035 [Clostridium diolis]|uniref:hypothetical protein n=1 Tax=Clostridium diolis TaxID=223919 RepID=UPI000B3FDC06|nr:hypothetical protein [Clostridium diolis]OVE70000.1 hypothetical protein CCS79_03035 [Clostridium diolis]